MRTFKKTDDKTIRVTHIEEEDYPVEKIQIIRTRMINNIAAFKGDIVQQNGNIKKMKAQLKNGEYLKNAKAQMTSSRRLKSAVSS